MRFSSNQVGVGFFGLIYNLAVVAVLAYSAFLLGPVYLENRAVKEALNGLTNMQVVERGDSLATATNKIRNFVAESFRMNNVVNVPLENIKVESAQGGYQIDIGYSVQKHFIANLDFTIDFNNKRYLPVK